MFRVNKEKCIGCGACFRICPGATKMGFDGKAEIINQEKLKECGGESVCSVGAIEKISGGRKPTSKSASVSPVPPRVPYLGPRIGPFPGPLGPIRRRRRLRRRRRWRGGPR